jgi:hypothetical protein
MMILAGLAAFLIAECVQGVYARGTVNKQAFKKGTAVV